VPLGRGDQGRQDRAAGAGGDLRGRCDGTAGATGTRLAIEPSLKRGSQRPLAAADTLIVDAAERKAILRRYVDHSRRFEAVAQRRTSTGAGEVIPFVPKERLQLPTAREIQVLQLIAEGLVNREIGQSLFLSEETVKSHVRHLLAKLQARSRAHAVAVGFRRGLIA
jgi:DNA-binding NarL/FixJ family response regulator